jgi:hypothetical protein
MYKTCQFEPCVKDDNYAACKTAYTEISGREIMPTGFQRVTAVLLISPS